MVLLSYSSYIFIVDFNLYYYIHIITMILYLFLKHQILIGVVSYDTNYLLVTKKCKEKYCIHTTLNLYLRGIFKHQLLLR